MFTRISTDPKTVQTKQYFSIEYSRDLRYIMHTTNVFWVIK